MAEGTRDVVESATVRTPRRGERRALATTTGTQVFKVPDIWFGKKVRFEAIGDTVHIQTAPDQAIAITPTDRDTITGSGAGVALSSPALTTIGEPLTDGMIKEWDFVAGVDVYLGIRGVAGGGAVYFGPAEMVLGGDPNA